MIPRRRPPPRIVYGTPYLSVQRELRRMLQAPAATIYVPPPPIDLTDDDRNYRPVFINTKDNLP